jgi:capsular polysaccharide biosynthesis protein/GGDEF domain-containing protein
VEFREYVEVIVRRRWIALTTFIVATAVTLGFVLPQASMYESTGTLVVGPRYFDREGAVDALDTLSNGEAITATYASIAESDLIRRRAGTRLDSTFASSELTVHSEVMLGTNVLSISVRGEDREAVRAFAEAIAAETVAYVDDLDVAYELKPLDAPNLTKEAGPGKAVTVTLGITLGAVLGVALALLGEYFGGRTLASWTSRAQSSSGLLDGLTIVDPGDYLRTFWQEVHAATENGRLLTFGMLRVAVRDAQKDDRSYALSKSHQTRIAELLEPDLGSRSALTYLGEGTFAVVLPDTSVDEAERLLSGWDTAILAIRDEADGESQLRLELSIGFFTSLGSVITQPTHNPSPNEADEQPSIDNALDMSRVHAERAWAWH